jgi:cell division protein FtsW
MVTSAGLSIDRRLGIESILLGRPALLAAASVAALVAGCLVPIERIVRHRGAIVAVSLAALMLVLLAAVHVPGVGHEVNGARRWIMVGPVGFQPSEVAKWTLLAVIAWYAALNAANLGTLVRGLVVPGVLIGAVCGLIVTEDLGTAVLIATVSGAMLVAGGVRLRHALVAVPPALAAFGAAVLTSPYRLERLRSFMDPWHDPQGDGYHLIHSLATVHGGGLAGRGLGNGLQKFGYLPEDTTDFIFAVICEELGVVGAACVIGLIAVLVMCAASIARRAATPFGRLFGLGVVLTIGLQAVINLAVVTGLAPTKGIALPLVSSGGTGWMLTSFCLGMVVAMERSAVIDPEPTRDERRAILRSLAHQPLLTRLDRT